MSAEGVSAVAILNRRFLEDYPAEAARELERMRARDLAALMQRYPDSVVARVWGYLAPDIAEAVLVRLPPESAARILTRLAPMQTVRLLARLPESERERRLAALAPALAQELRDLLRYPPDTAGYWMDPRVVTLREDLTLGEAVLRARSTRGQGTSRVYVTNDVGELRGAVPIERLLFERPDTPLSAIVEPLAAAVDPMAPREEVVQIFERYRMPELPVVDLDGRLLGVIRQDALAAAIQEEVSVDIQTMVGASKDERALSSAGFAVRKRLPWLQINLLTAFLAAAVVGLFEATIAQVTALAVLMPVVAGQAGNTGAQALAVTMRGLALREISVRQWFRVLWKEINVAFINGVAVALTTGAGVWAWSGSLALAGVIAAAMVLSMVAAGMAGAVIPMVLSRLGQDPAQSSSIILTTVTDVVGFMTFLGIGTLFAAYL